MKVIEYFETDNQEYWLSKIKECDWVAGKFLVELIQKNEVIKLLGQNTKVLLLINELELISFCTLSDIDDIETTDLTPWIGFVYTFPKYRGNRYMGNLFNYAEQLAKSNGFSNIYISTDQEGIYEKYGFTFLEFMKDRNNIDSRVYTKVL
jgi:GNAT superfamily N-acetyltransferase